MNKHMKCWLWKGMWGFAAISFVLAWVSVIIKAPIWQFDPLFLFWNALVLGVLATPIKLDCSQCNTCNADSHRGMM
jgi:hypothetical protein